jgi:anti-sigma factor ChrR (cupin superfamily)
MRLRDDHRQAAVVHFAEAPWIESPEPGVVRKLLERSGEEVARATSIVRYAPGAAFSPHAHERGEEFLVLDGVFSDEHGDHVAGTYVRNAPGSSHRPFSRAGCTIFVKLRYLRVPMVTRYSRGCAYPTSLWKVSCQAIMSRLNSSRRASSRLAASDLDGP